MADFWNDEPYIKEALKSVGDTIESTVSTAHGFIRPILLDHVRSGGKMLRPALVLITSKLGRQDVHDQAIRIASVIEMIHLASLVHDDIIDGADKRRGKATVFARLGAKQAVLAGDYLLARALVLIGGSDRKSDSFVVSNALSRLCESELDQDAGQGNFFVSRSTYLRRIAGKTASLFALSCYCGAALQDAEDTLIQMRCHRIGYNLGMAFQIQDDILDYAGDSEKLGKQTAKDLRCGIPTLPLILALEQEQKSGGNELAGLLKSASLPLKTQTVRKVLKLVNQLKGIELAQSMEESYRQRSLADIARLGYPEAEKQLVTLLSRLSKRAN